MTTSPIPAPSLDRKASLEVRVEAADLPRVRQAVATCGSADVDIVRVAPLPHSSRIRVFIAVPRETLAALWSAVMRSVSNGEFGPLTNA